MEICNTKNMDILNKIFNLSSYNELCPDGKTIVVDAVNEINERGYGVVFTSCQKKAVLDILEQMFNLGPLYTDYDGLFYIIHIDAYTIQTLPVEIYDCLVEAGMKMPYVS